MSRATLGTSGLRRARDGAEEMELERRSGRERRGQGDELAAALDEAFRVERRVGNRRRA
jgi:hypothetical protein